MRTLTAALALVGFAAFAASAPPDKTMLNGVVKWAEKHPKVYTPAAGEKPGVEVFGKYDVPAGWEVKSIQLDYMPKDGGKITTVEKVKMQDGKFGAVDPKSKKVTPMKVPIEPGKWSVKAVIVYEWKDGEKVTSVPVTSSLETIEVK